MKLSDARAEYCRAERLAVLFPENRAVQRMRKVAYIGWLQAVRTFRNGPTATQETPEGAEMMAGSTPTGGERL